jgi:hypothetical protein
MNCSVRAEAVCRHDLAALEETLQSSHHRTCCAMHSGTEADSRSAPLESPFAPAGVRGEPDQGDDEITTFPPALAKVAPLSLTLLTDIR